jgi:hypothetical protein
MGRLIRNASQFPAVAPALGLNMRMRWKLKLRSTQSTLYDLVEFWRSECIIGAQVALAVGSRGGELSTCRGRTVGVYIEARRVNIEHR